MIYFIFCMICLKSYYISEIRFMNPDESLHISNHVFNRLKACILIEDGGFSMKRACQNVGIGRQKFSERKWLSIYRKSPFNVVQEDKRGGTPTKMTTPVKGELKKVAHHLLKRTVVLMVL